MVFDIDPQPDDPRGLTQAALQVTALLGLYQAELARVLRLRCGDIGSLSAARTCLEPGSEAWMQAQHLVRFYRLLYARAGGDGVAMRHWLRVDIDDLGGSPHRLIVDEGRLGDVIDCLDRSPGLPGSGGDHHTQRIETE
jgi:hypothetical protein